MRGCFAIIGGCVLPSEIKPCRNAAPQAPARYRLPRPAAEVDTGECKTSATPRKEHTALGFIREGHTELYGASPLIRFGASLSTGRIHGLLAHH